MKIISWNVNGIRALDKKEKFSWLLQQQPEIFCIQETKCSPGQLSPLLITPPGYTSYFSSHTTKKGYSGVATYSIKEPILSQEDLGISELSGEGRIVKLDFGSFVLFNVYFPNGGGGPIRLEYKLKFYEAFLAYILKLKKEGRSIIFTGDVNTAHKEIDLARPKENEKNTGFLPEERAWIDKVVDAGFIDVFRMKYPEEKGKYTYWDMKTFARDRNVGWRIDYFFISSDLKEKVKDITIHDDVLGSDHCPISLTIDLKI